MRGALIDGGGAATRGLQAAGRPFERLEPIALERLAEAELSMFDVVVVPRSTDADRLFARRHQVRRFLDRGGVLVSFGEVLTGWLPGARWTPKSPVDISAPPTITDHPLLAGVAPDDLYWHRGPEQWCCHGHVVPPGGAEILVANGAGDAWLYLDRVSTGGTIVSGSNVDLDTHAFHGDATAESLLVRLLTWAGEEAARTADGRDGRLEVAPVAYAYSGVHFQHGFLTGPQGGRFATVPVEELAGIDLTAYAGLWVPRESDQRVLHANADRILGFIEDGGRAVVLEEVDRDWLPGIRWRRATVDVGDVRRTDHPLVTALGSFATPWHSHGVLDLPSDAEVLLATADGDALLGIVELGSGSLLAGTIDADAHAGYGSTLPQPFIDAAVHWLRTRGRVPVLV